MSGPDEHRHHDGTDGTDGTDETAPPPPQAPPRGDGAEEPVSGNMPGAVPDRAPEAWPGSLEASGPEPATAGGAHTRAGDGGPDGDWQRLHPLSVWASAAVSSLFMLPWAVIGTVALIVMDQSLWAIAPVPGTIALIAVFTSLDLMRLRATRFRVTTERMEMRSGIIAKAYRSIPRERVRSVDVAAPVYVRVFGLCSVTVGTGEQGGSDQLQLLYVTAEQGERLRRELLLRGTPASTGRRPSTGDAATGAADTDAPDTAEAAGADTAESEVELARLNPAWFAYAPATGATLGVGLGFIAALLGLNAQTGEVAWEWVSEQMNIPSAQEMSTFVMGRILVVAPLAFLVLLLSGVVVLTAVAVETWWNYRLTREPDGSVRLRRGLLTSVSLSVEGRRLNGVTLHQPFVLRSVRGASVRAVATGLAAADEKKTSAKSRLSPPMPAARARELSADLLRETDSPLNAPLTAHPRAALRRRFTRAGFATVLGAVLSGVLAWLHTLATEAWWEAVYRIEQEIIPLPLATRAVETTPSWGWALLAVATGVVAFWYAVGSYRGLGHGLHPRFLVVRGGMAVRETVALQRSAVIGWRITRSPFQRRLGLADVAATTAAGEGMYAASDVGLGQGLAWADEAVPELLAPFLVREGSERGPEAGGDTGRP